jgi:hypothetical protein
VGFPFGRVASGTKAVGRRIRSAALEVPVESSRAVNQGLSVNECPANIGVVGGLPLAWTKRRREVVRRSRPDGFKKDISRAIRIKIQKFLPQSQVVKCKKPKYLH